MRNIVIWLLAVMAAAAVLVSCGNNVRNDADAVSITNFEIRQCIKSSDKNYKVVTSYDTIYLDIYTSIQWPEQLGEADISTLRDSLIFFAYGDTVSRTIDKAITKFMDDTSMMEDVEDIVPVDSMPDAGSGIPTYFNNVMVAVTEIDEEKVTYQVTQSSYLGGAHPYTTIRPFTYDLRTGRVLTVENIVNAQARDSIVPVIVDALARQLDVAPSRLDQAGIFTNQLTYAGMPYISNNILYFHYNPYEIAPYSAGMIDVAVYPYEMEEMLTPEALSLFDEGY